MNTGFWAGLRASLSILDFLIICGYIISSSSKQVRSKSGWFWRAVAKPRFLKIVIPKLKF
jgi:hypothetical protein